MDTLVRVNCIKHKYEDETEVQVCGLDFVVKRGDILALLGPNGSGKTTLLNHIIGLLKPIEGKVEVFGLDPSKDLKKLIPKIGVVFQNVEYQLIGPTVMDDIVFTPINIGMSEKEAIKVANHLLKEIEISHLKHKVPHYLSGGEKKKVAIAGALAHNPELLIMDEPFAGIDHQSKKKIIEFLKKLNKEKNLTILFSTNQIDVVKLLAKRVYLMEKGRIKLFSSTKEFFRKKIKLEVCEH
ncbi:MAG: energy-coupling factor ABC transporter ATP-binding protein [Candidatus Aenigmarchaeota archaeon]|nr:energy-coupling factor ABC transporter ATP-binding protein [Candidatus Aenigmarchaeota archaeon]